MPEGAHPLTDHLDQALHEVAESDLNADEKCKAVGHIAELYRTAGDIRAVENVQQKEGDDAE